MNKKELFALLSLALFTIATPTYASSDDEFKCDEPDEIHCASVSGLKNNEGRFIKVYNVEKQMSFTDCFINNMYLVISRVVTYQEDAPDFLGTNTDQYSICTDSLGIQCEPLGTDVYTIINTGDKYTSEPKTYTIEIPAMIKAKYPQCSWWNIKGSNKKSAIKRPF